jgi:hypothetical protein
MSKTQRKSPLYRLSTVVMNMFIISLQIQAVLRIKRKLCITYTRKYMHAETPHLADKTIVFSEHEVFKVVVMVTR